MEVDQKTVQNTRIEEQKVAARILGVKDVHFMDFMDGSLVADLGLREEIIRYIRLIKPDVVVTCDPQNLFSHTNRINHPDHRAAGLAVLDAVFPAVNNGLIRTLDANGKPIDPHQVEEVWVTLTNQENISIDLTDYFEQKVDALMCHRSQILETREELTTRLKTRFIVSDGSIEPRYIEKFRRIQITQ